MDKKLDKIIESTYSVLNKLEEKYKTLKNDVKLNEDSLLDHLDTELEMLDRRFDAARRGLTLANKLRNTNSPTGQKHVNRVLSNLSKLRTSIIELEEKMRSILR